MQNKSTIILGIDPGLVKTGWGVVQKLGYDFKYIDCGIIKTDPACKMEERLTLIYDSVSELIDRFNPTEISMEEVFVNMNPSTSEKLIMARTSAFIAISKSGFQVNEYKPNEIKKNITGQGHADKNQVYIMIQKILNVSIETDRQTKTMDAMDAIAVALCHAFTIR